MAVPSFTFTRRHAAMIAEELYKLMKPESKEITKEVVQTNTEEFLGLKDAAKFLGIAPSTLYKTKDVYGCYTKVNGRLVFAKNRLIHHINSGVL